MNKETIKRILLVFEGEYICKENITNLVNNIYTEFNREINDLVNNCRTYGNLEAEAYRNELIKSLQKWNNISENNHEAK